MAIKDDKPSKGRETKIDKSQADQSSKSKPDPIKLPVKGVPKSSPPPPGMKTVSKTVKCARCKRDFVVNHAYTGNPKGGKVELQVKCRYCGQPKTVSIEAPGDPVEPQAEQGPGVSSGSEPSGDTESTGQ